MKKINNFSSELLLSKGEQWSQTVEELKKYNTTLFNINNQKNTPNFNAISSLNWVNIQNQFIRNILLDLIANQSSGSIKRDEFDTNKPIAITLTLKNGEKYNYEVN